MEKIESFKINHLTLKPGLYVSRRDSFDSVECTSFDLRMTSPNKEPVMMLPAIHTIEHLGATFFRNSDIKERVVYFGPMGCSTGFYLVLFGHLESTDIYKKVLEFCDFVLSFEGEIPGATPRECGNYSEQNLAMAKYYVQKYKSRLEENPRFEYSL